MPSGNDILKLARKRIGDKYVLGARVPKDNANWTGPWDCAEFCSWLVYQTSGKLYGCLDNTAGPSVADAYTGYWARDAQSIGESVPIERAMATPGAMLLRVPASNRGGHIVVSDGKGGTVEAHSTARGVIAHTAARRTWDVGILVPGYDYAAAPAPAEPKPPKTVVYRLADPNMEGPVVKQIQKALKEKGFNPGILDGVFGPHTESAVLAYQTARRMVADGAVGPQTARSLGVKLPKV